MMTTKKLLGMFIGILAMGTILSSCGKDGDIGPAGPQGANGTPGATGPAGPVGSANVIYSDWITIPKGVFVDNNWAYNIPAAGLSKDHIDKGVILSYLGFGTQALALPFTEPNASGGAISYFTSAVQNSHFSLYVRWVGSTFPSDWATNDRPGFIAGTKFRYIIIPGSVKTAMKPGVNLKDYNEVAKYFNITL